MENDIQDSLEDLGYDGPLLEESSFQDAVSKGTKSVAFTQCVEWIVSQITSFCNMEEKVSAIQGPSDSEVFLMELSGFLRECSCPHEELTSGPMESRLASKAACLQLLDFLLTELASVKMIAVKKPSALSSSSSSCNEPVESDVAKHLKLMMIALKFSKPPPNITAFQMFSKLEAKVKELVSKYPGQAGSPLLKARLSDKQWAQIMDINRVLSDEYRVWREMLLKRLDVTIQSFKWSDKAKGNENRIAEVYQPIRKIMSSKTSVNVPQILAARDDLTRLQKTSSGEARERTKCAINKVLIGKVPDRGGRAWELEPPPPEMPSFMKRDAAPGRPQSQSPDRRFEQPHNFQAEQKWFSSWFLKPPSIAGVDRVEDLDDFKDIIWNKPGRVMLAEYGGQRGGRGGGRGGYQDGGGRGGGGGFQDGGGRGGGGGGFQDGGGRSRVQGGWGDSQQNQNIGGNWNQGGGGYRGGGARGNYHHSGGGGGGYQGGGGGYQGGGGGGYQSGGGGGGYQGGGGGGYQSGGGGGGYQGGGGGGYQGGGRGYQGGRGGRGSGGRGGRGGRGRF